MPTVYTPQEFFHEKIPLPDDGDDYTAFVDAAQRLGDRTQHLAATRAQLADVDALRALSVAGFKSGVVRSVKGGASYVYDSTSIEADSAPWVIAPTVGAGRWIGCIPHSTQRVRLIQGAAVTGVTAVPVLVEHRSVGAAAMHPINDADIESFRESGLARHAAINGGTVASHGFLIPITDHLIDGAVLSSVRGRLAPPFFSHYRLPEAMPAFGVRRVSRLGIVESLKAPALAENGSPVLGTDIVQDPTDSVEQYNLEHEWTLTTDQLNKIDLDNFTYDIVAFYEGGAGSAVLGGWVSWELTFNGRFPPRAYPFT